MSIKSIPAGKLVRTINPNTKVWDYSHLLPKEHQDNGYSLSVEETPSEKGTIEVSAIVKNKNYPKSKIIDYLGRVGAEHTPDGLKFDMSFLDAKHRGKGLGMAMYEAVLAHGKNVLGAQNFSGDTHSSLAHHVWSKLSQKHGLDYKTQVNPFAETLDDWGSRLPGEYDAKYGPYTGVLKSEDSKIKKVASIAVFDSAGKLLFGLRNDTQKWTLPGGHFEPGEIPVQAAYRELFEEAGIDPENLDFMGDEIIGKYHIYAFKCILDEKSPEIMNDNDPDNECDRWEFVDVTEGVPERIAGKLHSPKNVTLRLLGLQDQELSKSGYEELLEKSLKHKFLAIAAAVTIPNMNISHKDESGHLPLKPAETMVINEPTTITAKAPPWTPRGLHPELHAIAHLESNFGANIKHASNPDGPFHTAFGPLGFKPVTAHDEMRIQPWLRKMYPGLEDPEKFMDAFQKDHQMYNTIANAHWDRLKRSFKGSLEHAAYGWRFGYGSARDADDETVKAAPYVLGYMNLHQKIKKSEAQEEYLELIKTLPDLVNKISQAGFRLPNTGQVYPTGTFHDITALPEGVDSSSLEDGFITEQGEFITRAEATSLMHLNNQIQSQDLGLKKSLPSSKPVSRYPPKSKEDLKNEMHEFLVQFQDWIKSRSLDKAELEGLSTPSKLSDEDCAMGHKMAGTLLQDTREYRAAKSLSTTEEPDQETIREALNTYDDDLELAMMMAFGIARTEANRKELRRHMESMELSKSDIDVAAIPRIVSPVLPESQALAESIQDAFKNNQVRPISFKGKHSKGMAVVWDAKGNKKYLIKPGSGPLSPARGVAEESANQSRREVAFSKIAELIGLDEYVPHAELLDMDGQEVAALELLPLSFKGLDKLKKERDIAPIFKEYLDNGDLFKWAVMDYVLGNCDRHGGNLMANSKDEIKLIDHGTTFASESFNPAHDLRSFIPFYLRCFTKQKFVTLDYDKRYAAMPKPSKGMAKDVSDWFESWNFDKILKILEDYGINPKPVLERLEAINKIPPEKRVDYVLMFFAGMVGEKGPK